MLLFSAMTLMILRQRRDVSIRALKRVICGLFQDCAVLYQVANESPEDFPWRASAISAHWTPIITRILASNLPDIEELEGLTNLVAFLILDVEEFLPAFPEQVEAVFDACDNYTPLDQHWAEMEPVLLDCLQRMQGGEGEVQEEDAMLVG